MAATILNNANCGNSTNMGTADCPLNPGVILYTIPIPKGYVIPNASLTSNSVFNTKLYTLINATDSKSARCYITKLLTEIKDSTGDPVTEDRNNTPYIVTNKPYNWKWLVNCSFCDYRNMLNLLSLAQDKFDFLYVDDQFQVWGRAANDTSSLPGMGGFSMAQVFVPDFMTKTTKNLPKYEIQHNFLNNTQLTLNGVFAQSNFDPTQAHGLIDVVLSAGTTSSTATVLYVQGAYGCAASNLGDTYGSTLAAAAAWSVVPAAGGAAIVPSGVVYNAILKQWALTIASTPATALIVGLAVPSVLTATPYFAYLVTETSNKVTITTP